MLGRVAVDVADHTDSRPAPPIDPCSASSGAARPRTRENAPPGDDGEASSRLVKVTSPIRVLVIEDEPLVREAVCDVVRFLGHRVTAAPDGLSGVELFERDPYDLVITDLLMPRLAGWGVIERVRQADPAVPVIILTGAATSDDLDRARAARIRLLEKPLRIQDLRAAIGTPSSP